jgi:hypothetical protein
MDVTTYTGALTVEADGGKGGDELDDGIAQRCYGAGGGGGAGSIYFTGAMPAITTSVSGGLAGSEINRSGACSAAVLPLNGSNGTTTTSYTLRQSTDSASYCLSLEPLPVSLIFFRAVIVSENVELKWKLASVDAVKNIVIEKLINDHWTSLQSINVSGQSDFSWTDVHPISGKNLYRLRMIEKNNLVSYSPLRYVNFKTESDNYVIYPNPARDRINITAARSIERVIISTITGKICVDQKFVSNSHVVNIELPGLPAGIYSIQINDVVKKLVIAEK